MELHMEVHTGLPWAIVGPLGLLWVPLGPLWTSIGPLWAPLRPLWASLGPLWAPLCPWIPTRAQPGAT